MKMIVNNIKHSFTIALKRRRIGERFGDFPENDDECCRISFVFTSQLMSFIVPHFISREFYELMHHFSSKSFAMKALK